MDAAPFIIVADKVTIIEKGIIVFTYVTGVYTQKQFNVTFLPLEQFSDDIMNCSIKVILDTSLRGSRNAIITAQRSFDSGLYSQIRIEVRSWDVIT
jgi:hypothetical protein